jgi:uncharacterized protein (TIGR03435 family)
MLRLILFFIASCVLQAQTFEVASVRPNQKAACQGRWDFTAAHGAVNAENAPLLRILSRAYNLTDDRVSGPAWLNTQCYDIHAKTSRPATDADLMSMLRTLLKERFHLVAERGSEERPVYMLLIDKDGLKMRPYGDHNAPPPPITDGKMLFLAKRLPDLCERLGKVLGRPVVDKTGLDAAYMIVLTYQTFGTVNNGDATDPASDIFAAVPEQLGLRLEAQRGTVDYLKIDRIDKTPTEN